jgi:arylsulfatase
VDGKQLTSQTIPHSVPFVFGVDESFDVGSDTGTPVDDKDYQVPFAFTGSLHKLTVKLEPTQLNVAGKEAVQNKVGTKD